MGIKRPSHKADPQALARAEALRRGGSKYEDIEREVGITKGALCQHFKAVGLARGRDQADDATARDDLRANRLGRLASKVRRALERQADLLAASDEVNAKAIGAFASALDKALRYERLLRGAPTSHTKSERAAPAELSAEEKRLLDLADQADMG